MPFFVARIRAKKSNSGELTPRSNFNETEWLRVRCFNHGNTQCSLCLHTTPDWISMYVHVIARIKSSVRQSSRSRRRLLISFDWWCCFWIHIEHTAVELQTSILYVPTPKLIIHTILENNQQKTPRAKSAVFCLFAVVVVIGKSLFCFLSFWIHVRNRNSESVRRNQTKSNQT